MTSYWRTLRKASPTARLYLVRAVLAAPRSGDA